jgi:hypothetical protein
MAKEATDMASRAMMILTSAILLSALCGCQGLNRVFHRAGTNVAPRTPEPHALLIADFALTTQEAGRSPDQQSKPARTAQSPTPNTSTDQADEPAPPETEEQEELDPWDEEEKPTVRLPFTAPSEAVRQLTLLAAASGDVAVDDEDVIAVGGAGKEAAEALAGGATPFVGQPGLSAPQPTVAGVVVSRPGLQRGPATGLCSASPFNILTPQTNPASGNMGRCTDLTRAGFFGGSASACQMHFQRQTKFRFVPSR